MVSHLNQQVKDKTSVISNLQLKLSTAPRATKVDLKDLEMANKNAKTIDELEKLLLQRTEEYN